MNIEQKKNLRLVFLKELYDYFFKEGGAGRKVTIGKEDKNEKVAAMLYLKEKGLVTFNCHEYGEFIDTKITANGIDLIESTEIFRSQIN